MEKLPEKPNGSIIEEEADSGGITLRWPPPAAGFAHYPLAVGYTVFLVPVAIGCFQVLRMPAGFFATIFALCVCTSLGACLVYGVWSLLRPDRPESVRLEPEWLRYDPGYSKVNAFPELFGKPSRKGDPPSPSPRPIAVRRSEIRGLVLDRLGERQRLSFECGSDRVEIGASLREPEREWLYAVLQRWMSPNQLLQPTAAR